MAKTVYEHIQKNNLKTWGLIALFPISLCAVMFVVLYLFMGHDPESWAYARDFFSVWAPIVLIIAAVWMLVSYFWGDKMMLGFAGATRIDDNGENRKIFRAVENVALAAGLPTPKVYIMDDSSLNAFATGHHPKTASVAVTRGLIDKLEPLELEGVIAHEMAHIGNRDIRLHILIITGLGVFGVLGEGILRARMRNGGKGVAVAKAAGLAMLIFYYLVAPLIRLAISRTNEYNADATAALITRNPAALASALEKIKKNAHIERFDEKPQMAVACIFDPRQKKMSLSGLGSTHPDVNLRIKRLNEMARQLGQ